MKRFLAAGLIALAMITGCANAPKDTSVGKKVAMEQAQIRYEADMQIANGNLSQRIADRNGRIADDGPNSDWNKWLVESQAASYRRYRTVYPLRPLFKGILDPLR